MGVKCQVLRKTIYLSIRMNLWTKDEERKFFQKTIEIFPVEKLFYKTDDGRYLAYWPKGYKGETSTLQSRNAIIGNYTEKWARNLLEPIAKELGAYAINNVVCEEIGLTKKSPADVAIVRKRDTVQSPQDILLLVEVKMSIVWNWEYKPDTGEIIYLGDYTTHKGTPGLLRSDSVLKAIGKSINIKVSGLQASRIPILIIGNTPITNSYIDKVDFLKQAGIVQGFLSVNPNPTDNPDENIVFETPGKGFQTINEIENLESIVKEIIEGDGEFFSAMLPKKQLGRIIEIASQEPDYIRKAERFLELIRSI